MGKNDTAGSPQTGDKVVDAPDTVLDVPSPEPGAVYVGTDTTATSPLPTEPVKIDGNQGRTLLRTKVGYAFDHGLDGIPTITSAGVYVTAEQADQILDLEMAALSTVYKDTDQEGE